MEKYIKIGEVVNTHSLKGNVKANVYTENLLDIKKYTKIYLSKKDINVLNKESDDLDLKTYIIKDVKESKNQVILKLENIDDIDQAEALKRTYIYITEEEMKEKNPLKSNEYYIKDLIGLNVYDEEENLIGNIKEVLELNTDVYVIKCPDERKDILIPAVKEFVKDINIENNKMIVRLGGLDEI